MRVKLHPPTLLTLSILCLATTSFSQTVTFVKLEETAPSKNELTLSPEECYLQGVTHQDANEPEKAAEFYTLALNQNSKHLKALFNRSMVLQAMGKLTDAKADLDQLLVFQPTDVEAFELRAGIYFQQDQFAKAVADYNDALELTEKASLYVGRGMAFSKMDYYKEAFLDFDTAIEMNPNFYQAFSKKGEVYAALKQYREAIFCYNRALNINPYDADIHNNRASARCKLGAYEQAIEDFNRAIEMKPQSQIFVNRGLCFLESGEYIKAKQDGVAGMILYPDNPEAYYCIGMAELERQELDASIKSFDVAIDLNPQEADYYLGRARAQFYMGQYYKTIADCYEIERLKSNSKEAEDLLQLAFQAVDQQNMDWMKENDLSPQRVPQNIQNTNPFSEYSTEEDGEFLQMELIPETEQARGIFEEDPFGNN